MPCGLHCLRLYASWPHEPLRTDVAEDLVHGKAHILSKSSDAATASSTEGVAVVEEALNGTPNVEVKQAAFYTVSYITMSAITLFDGQDLSCRFCFASE
jgi:hypothetical protein